MLVPFARGGSGDSQCIGVRWGWVVLLSDREAWVEDSWPGEMGQDISGSWGPRRKGPDKEDLKTHPLWGLQEPSVRRHIIDPPDIWYLRTLTKWAWTEAMVYNARARMWPWIFAKLFQHRWSELHGALSDNQPVQLFQGSSSNRWCCLKSSLTIPRNDSVTYLGGLFEWLTT